MFIMASVIINVLRTETKCTVVAVRVFYKIVIERAGIALHLATLLN
ncbi:hypothetical protein RchiOBHm_Chr6g0244301 [Rosa chinensis]|uniref:Uncharacterized protein n=1 Tax=Rosa chinensis TaxID=74649 RepID=A0A2P6PIZ4_ROSCH|nr:hypothetical protein RchiOBHm_Chr6g0244301 [Rosa chinensis]